MIAWVLLSVFGIANAGYLHGGGALLTSSYGPQPFGQSSATSNVLNLANNNNPTRYGFYPPSNSNINNQQQQPSQFQGNGGGTLHSSYGFAYSAPPTSYIFRQQTVNTGSGIPLSHPQGNFNRGQSSIQDQQGSFNPGFGLGYNGGQQNSQSNPNNNNYNTISGNYAH